MIAFEHTGKSYAGHPAVTDLNLRIAQGELVVLLGPSGAGKSTVLQMMNRMVEHDEGRILFNGQEINRFKVHDLRRRMGYAMQSVGLFPHWTVARNIATVPQLLGWESARVQARVTELMHLLGLEPADFANRYPHQLSGGQQQRVGVARALAADPDMLLMDEPFGALDPVTRAALQLELKRIHQATGKTIVLVTHDIDEALLLATRIVLLHQGRIAQQGTPLELLVQPKSDFVADFFGRADRGLKQLSLRPIASMVRPSAGSAPAHPIAVTATVREAISLMAVHGVSVLQVVKASSELAQPATGPGLGGQLGDVLGEVHAADLLEARRG